MIAITVTFVLGILSGGLINFSFLFYYVLSAVLVIAALFLRKKRLPFCVAIILLVFFTGIICLKNSDSLPACHISKFISYRNEAPDSIQGFISNDPERKNGQTIFTFRAEALYREGLKTSCRGEVLIFQKEKAEFVYGEELVLNGFLRRASSRYPRLRGVSCIMAAKGQGQVVRLNRNRGSRVKKIIFLTKNRIKKVISSYCTPLTAAVLNAMLLGEKNNIPFVLYKSMMESGIVHILVVSGFNVAIVILILSLILKIVRLPRKIRVIITIFSLVFYCFLTGASTPVVRATIMGSIFLSSYLIKREADIYNAISLALIFILICNPRQVFDIGLQLSFASVLAIVFLYPRFKDFTGLDKLKFRPVKNLFTAVLVSFSAWLGTFLLIAYNFKIFSPITVLANLCLVPLATLITLCGFTLIISSVFLPGITPFFASTTELIVILLLRVNAILLKIPFSHFYLG